MIRRTPVLLLHAPGTRTGKDNDDPSRTSGHFYQKAVNKMRGGARPSRGHRVLVTALPPFLATFNIRLDVSQPFHPQSVFNEDLVFIFSSLKVA